jgi:hypothetical protein
MLRGGFLAVRRRQYGRKFVTHLAACFEIDAPGMDVPVGPNVFFHGCYR